LPPLSNDNGKISAVLYQQSRNQKNATNYRKEAGRIALDWSSGQPLSDNAVFHVEHQPNADSRVLDFPLYGHPEWRGRIRGLRLHLFNLYQEGFNRRLSLKAECRGTGYLRWLRALKLG